MIKSFIRLFSGSACFLLFACSGDPNPVKLTAKPDPVHARSWPDSSDIDLNPGKNTTDSPGFLLVKMADYLDSLGFSADTSQAKKVGYASAGNEKIIFDNKVFYRQPLTKPHLFDMRGLPQVYDGIDTSTIRRKLFYKAKALHSYFYFEKHTGDDVIRDGAIDEWQFKNEQDADSAGLEMNRIKRLAYFYTAAYVARCKSHLYVFHNRAAFDWLHRKTLKRFANVFDKQYPDLPNGE